MAASATSLSNFSSLSIRTSPGLSLLNHQLPSLSTTFHTPKPSHPSLSTLANPTKFKRLNVKSSADIDTTFFDNVDPEDIATFDPPEAPEGFVAPPSFDEGPFETEDEIAAAYEEIYGPAYSGVSVLGGNVNVMDSNVKKTSAFGKVKKEKVRDGFDERVVQVRRVTKVVKGGKQLHFRAVVVVGDKKGQVGVGVGKAKEVIAAVQKSATNARRNIITVPLTKYSTFPHRQCFLTPVMKCLGGFAPAMAAATTVRPSLFCSSKKKTNGRLRARLNVNEDEDDPLFEAAVSRASLRFQETHRPEPLLVDPYSGCFIPTSVQLDMKHHAHQFCLATRFIDDKLLSKTKNIDGLKQVVLLTDGMDTRPYRLSWPTSTIIFDISPERVFRRAAQMLEDVGAKIPRGCLFLHVPVESSDIQQILSGKGFTGNRPSVWALQGFPVTNLASFKDILFIVGNLAMKGCIFLGELPIWLAETEIGIKSTTKKWMDKLFMTYGFRVDVIGYDEVGRNLDKEPALGDYGNLLFVAEHLRYSDDQMETWRREFQRVEEEGDEEGFEEL